MTTPLDVVGVDGCRAGWISVARSTDGRLRVAVHAAFASLLDSLPENAVVAVDMPIGLPDFTTCGGRGPEALVRPLLGRRQSSVFSIPSRSAVYASCEPFTTLDRWYDGHRRASAIARETSDPPRGVSIQAFGIFSKVREIDALLRANPVLAGRVHESHHEVALWGLNGQKPLREPKKISGRVHRPGMEERRQLLGRGGLDPVFVDMQPPSGAGADDFLDACSMLLVAERIVRGQALSFPDPPSLDGFGIPVAIRV